MRAKPIRKLTGATAAAVLVLGLLAACDSDKSSEESDGSASPSTSTSLSVSAANGTDLAACQDADCEVVVKAGDQLTIDHKFEVDKITVSSLGLDEIKLALEGSSGGFQLRGRNVSVSSSCVNGDCRDTGSLGLTVGAAGKINEISVELISADRDRAVLRLQPS